ncbi:hypothetical protein GYMLUDRAFT_46783 [Collybiopsis luxurians FD-317 M1]|uniref:Unplaced genomic scaffold GYMLUscaffold_46, whole genome shotgun sequence n=1 Tax=Collybiopsis luxurians FD-317 M1 TaxID=944289 RepID=A0A0D0CNN5_9AGAR|nr:hypothetical protein GYMLUDRAFT_46783 [Collybiopsis luxurians FD-317 M1]
MACPQCGFLGTRKLLNTSHERLPSAIEALLQNNESPPDAESSLGIQNLLQEAEHASADLESQIQLMQASITRLSTQRELIMTNIQAYRTVLHPIRRLPREVILEIFEWCVGVNSIEPDSVVTDDPDLKLPGLRVVSSLSSGKAPWVLGQISRSWRAIALSSPKLWSSVSIFLRTHHQTAALQRRVELAQVSLLALYLTRSQDYPLSLYVNSLHASHPLLSMLYAQSHRWRNAVLYLPIEALRDLSFSVKGALPLLRNLLFSITRDPAAASSAQHNWETVMTPGVVIDAFRFAPALKCLATSQIPSFPTTFSIPWDQLIRFECNLKSEAHQQSENSMNIDIMRRASNIRMAMFRCCHSPSLRFLSNQQPLRHLHLHTLNLFSVLDSNPSVPHVAQFLDYITLPALRQLSIRTQRRETDTSEDVILRFIERSDSKFLRVVSLNDMPMSVEATQRLLRIIPTVEHLGLSGVTDEIVKTLYWMDEAEDAADACSSSSAEQSSGGGNDSDGVDGHGGDGDDSDANSTQIPEAPGGTVLPRLKRLAFFGSESWSVNQRLLLGMIESRRRSSFDSAASASGPKVQKLLSPTQSLIDVGEVGVAGGGARGEGADREADSACVGNRAVVVVLERMELSRKFSFSDPDAIYRLDRLLQAGLVLDQR